MSPEVKVSSPARSPSSALSAALATASISARPIMPALPLSVWIAQLVRVSLPHAPGRYRPRYHGLATQHDVLPGIVCELLLVDQLVGRQACPGSGRTR